MELSSQPAGTSVGARNHEIVSSPRGRQIRTFLAVFLVAVSFVAALSVLTNRMPVRWDVTFYVDMAINGITGNHHLTTPFAYRPAVPMTIFVISHALHTDPELTFHAATHVIAVMLLILMFYFMRSFGASEYAAWCGMLALGLNFEIVRYPLFMGAMLDIYGYFFVVIAFWGVLRRRFYPVLLLCTVGLFVKEFMIAPLLAQAAVLAWETPRARWRNLLVPVGLTGLAVVFYLAFTRAEIPVVDSLQHIDPHRPETLRYFFTHPISPLRWFNIIYSTLSFWLPCVLLMTRDRWRLVRTQLAPYARPIVCFVFFQMLLIMYGGNNIHIFVGYSLGIELLVLAVLIDRGAPQTWEVLLIAVVLVVFNRIGVHIPTYEEGGWDELIDFYGGYGIEVRLHSVLRFFEIWAYVGVFNLLRTVTGRTSTSARAGLAH